MSISKKRLTVPVLFGLSTGKYDWTHRRLAVIEHDFRVLSAAEAPVTSSMWIDERRGDGGPTRTPHKRVQQRSVDGDIFFREADLPNKGGLLEFEDSARNPHAWQRALRLNDHLNPILLHATNRESSMLNPRYVEGEVDDPAYRTAVDKIRRRADDVVIIDGEAWRRDLGPAYQLAWRPTGHPEPAAIRTFAQSTDRSFYWRVGRYAPTELDTLLNDFEAATGTRLTFDERFLIDVKDPAAFKQRYDDGSLEQAAWTLNYMVRRSGAGDIGRRGVSALADMREILQLRLPGRKLNFDKGIDGGFWPHDGFQPPKTSLNVELAQAAKRLLDAASHEVEPAWRMFLRTAMVRAKRVYANEFEHAAEREEVDEQSLSFAV